MFLKAVRTKGHEYLLIVENQRAAGRHVQKTVRYLGRRDRLDMKAVMDLLQRLRDGVLAA